MKNHKKKFLSALVLATSLFFLWGIAYGLPDVLNKHFQETLYINKQRSTLLQAAYFDAYFLMALPAVLLINKLAYRDGIIIAGVLLYAAGIPYLIPSICFVVVFLFGIYGYKVSRISESKRAHFVKPRKHHQMLAGK